MQDSEVDISRGNYVASYIEGSIANGSGSNTEPLEMKSREVHGWSWFVGREGGGVLARLLYGFVRRVGLGEGLEPRGIVAGFSLFLFMK